MKLLKIFPTVIILMLAFGLVFTGCKKNSSTPLSNSGNESTTQLANDQVTIQAAQDESENDINMILSGGMGQLKNSDRWPCHATIDSTSLSNNDTIIYYITYNGANCPGNRTRTGHLEIKKKIGTRWWQAGATVIVTFIDFKITRVSTGKSITLNGTRTYENVTGGLLFELGTTNITSITHKTWGSMSVTFDDGTVRTWAVARQDVFTGSLGQLVIAVDGFESTGNYNNLVYWGTNRNGEQFYIQINQTVIHRQACEWDPCAGIEVISIPNLNKGATLTFGYNNLNQLISGTECPTKFKVDWYVGNQSGEVFLFLP